MPGKIKTKPICVPQYHKSAKVFKLTLFLHMPHASVQLLILCVNASWISSRSAHPPSHMALLCLMSFSCSVKHHTRPSLWHCNACFSRFNITVMCCTMSVEPAVLGFDAEYINKGISTISVSLRQK